MKFKTSHRTVHTLSLDGDTEIELDFEPYYENDILVERVGDKIVVAYLVHDDSPSNPMENGCQGKFVERESSYDSYDEIMGYLGIDIYGPDIDKLWACEPYMHNDVQFDRMSLRTLAELAFPEEQSEDKIEQEAVALYPKYWRKLADPYVVPMRYDDYRSGGIRICVDEWDGESDNLPNCLWVPDAGCIENIECSTLPEGVEIKWQSNPLHALPEVVEIKWQSNSLRALVRKDNIQVFDSGPEPGSWGRALSFVHETYGRPNEAAVLAAAEKYAKVVAEEYESWCNGEVYGCVVQTFENGVEVENDACWGFIGHDYAKEALKDEYFEPAVEQLKETK